MPKPYSKAALGYVRPSCIQQPRCAGSDNPEPPRPAGNGRKAKLDLAESGPITQPPRNRAAKWYRLVSWLFARTAVREALTTRVHLNASPDIVWKHIMLYEEVPGEPPFLLRTLLPHPFRTEGDKSRVGAIVRCAYREGDLVKRIASVEPPHFLQFEVVEQRLGIEGCTLTLGGSYKIQPCENGSDVVLTTNYWAYLSPRFMWRPLEALLVHQLHRHIINGVHRAILLANRGVLAAIANSHAPQCACPRGFGWTESRSFSLRW